MRANVTATPPRLELRGLTLRFGGLTALDGVNLQVAPGEICAVIGPNGAGKTSLFNAITGIYEPTAGAILVDGADLRQPPGRADIARWLGVGLLGAVAAVLVASDLNALWAATVKALPPERWRLDAAFQGLGDHLAMRSLFDHALTALLAFVVCALGARAIWLRGRCSPQTVALRGAARTFQNIRLFSQLSVRDNVLVAMDRGLRGAAGVGPLGRLRVAAGDAALPGVGLALIATLAWLHAAHPPAAGPAPLLASVALFGLVCVGVAWVLRVSRLGALTASASAAEAEARREADALLGRVGLAARADDRATALPYGDQRRLEIARALATRPTLLLLDEPAAGMNASEIERLKLLITEVRASGVTVLLIEHHMSLVMAIADRVAVLVHGRTVATGTPAEVRADPAVIAAYLGDEGAQP